jgi:hypothetical protein
MRPCRQGQIARLVEDFKGGGEANIKQEVIVNQRLQLLEFQNKSNGVILSNYVAVLSWLVMSSHKLVFEFIMN